MDLELEEEPIEQESDSVDLPMPSGMVARDYQQAWLKATNEGWETYNRQLVVAATGTGKTVFFSIVTAHEVKRKGRVLILCHVEELLAQAADKLFAMTGLVAEREKADEYASLGADVVIASIQTLCKDNRLTAFPDNHFALVIVDEAHLCLSRSFMKVMCYFHFGESSLDESWVMPEPGTEYKHKARILGVTATDDRGDRRSLGQFFQRAAAEYNLIDACRDGYLVRPIVKNLPLKIDIKGVSMRGKDFDAQEVAERLTPLLREIARQIAVEAKDRKTIIFVPSIDAARRLSESCAAEGLNASFVSGACPDRTDKVAAFKSAGVGTVICNAMLLSTGFDAPDVSCVCVLRPTKIRSLMVQCCGRASRVLPGVIDGLDTKEARIRAIACSKKRDFLIIDFLWLSDRLDLVKPVDLVATRSDMKDRMQSISETQTGAIDLLDLEGVATRDLLKSLEAAARKNANKAARVLDPLAWAVDLGDAKLATWEPQTEFDRRPPTPGQIDLLKRQRIDTDKIKYFGLATALIARLMTRYKLHLATPHQLHFLAQLGVPAAQASMLSAHEAGAAITRIKGEKEAKRASIKAMNFQAQT